MLEPGVRRRRQRRLGVVGDPEPGRAHHVEVVGPVADRQRRLRRDAQPPPRAACSAASLAARPRIGRADLAGQHARPATSSALAWWRANPAAAATRSVKKLKPPETSAVSAPSAAMVRTSVRAPGLSRTRSS